MYSKRIEELKALMKAAENKKFNETVARGALGMTDEQMDTVSFVFWLVYMAETHLDKSREMAWKIATEGADSATIEAMEKMLKEKMGEPGFDVRNPPYFSQKIKIHEAHTGNEEQTKLLQELSRIRNDLSHNRINDLNYYGESLFSREVKEKAALDFFELTGDFNEDEDAEA